MGLYINELNGMKLPNVGKASILILRANATIILQPTVWKEDLVCIVDKGNFEAAAYCRDDYDLKRFSDNDGRSKVWLELPGAKTLAK